MSAILVIRTLHCCQGQAAKKDSPYTSSVWETLPITEKGKDEIDFSGLSAEVGSIRRDIVCEPG